MIENAKAAVPQELVQDLLSLGFSDYEARAYIALLSLPPATAYEVSKLAGLPKANSYAVLDSLSNKQAVQPVSENPVRYVAIAPHILFERIASTTEQRCARLKDGLGKLPRQLSHDYVWSITGAAAIGTKIAEMIDAAKDHIWVKASEERLEPHRAALQAAADRGVAILVILFGRNLDRFQFGGKTRAYLHEGNGIPVGIAPYLITLTRDFEEALVADLRGTAQGSYTRNRPVVTMVDTLIRHEIYFAEIFEKFGDDIQAAFGPALIELRRKYLPEGQAQALEERLAKVLKNGAAPRLSDVTT